MEFMKECVIASAKGFVEGVMIGYILMIIYAVMKTIGFKMYMKFSNSKK